MRKNLILALYRGLRRKHGRPADQWLLWCKRPKTTREKEEIIIGAILTQRTNWKNVKLATAQLKEVDALSLKKIYLLAKRNPRRLGKLIKASGFYKTKVRYLTEVARYFVERGGVAKVAKLTKGTRAAKVSELRSALLQLRGVGPETADSILLYALEKPVFVIDEYTRRLIKRKRLSRKLSYDSLQRLFENNLPRDWRLYQDFHALIVIDGSTKLTVTSAELSRMPNPELVERIDGKEK